VADNTAQNGVDIIATDEISSGVAAGAKVQRVKVGHGTDGTYRDASPGNGVPVAPPTVASASIVTAATANPGSTYTAFGSAACNGLDIVNETGVAIEYRRGGAGSPMQIGAGRSRLVVGITNANEVSVRRVDQSNTSVTVAAEALVY
jgi:hypothetical protein